MHRPSHVNNSLVCCEKIFPGTLCLVISTNARTVFFCVHVLMSKELIALMLWKGQFFRDKMVRVRTVFAQQKWCKQDYFCVGRTIFGKQNWSYPDRILGTKVVWRTDFDGQNRSRRTKSVWGTNFVQDHFCCDTIFKGSGQVQAECPKMIIHDRNGPLTFI